MTPIATGQAVLQALGLDHIRHITSLRLEAHGHQAPVVTLTLLLPRITAERTQHFELRALPDAPRPLDLDHLCDAAMARITDHVNRSATEHLRQISPRGYQAARSQVGSEPGQAARNDARAA